MSKPRITSMRFDFFDLLGDIPAATMLTQLHFWHDKAMIRRDGHRWIAKSQKEWWDECRLSRRKTVRALRILLKRGLIEMRLFRFRRHATRHFRLLLIAPNVQTSKAPNVQTTIDRTEPTKAIRTEEDKSSSVAGGTPATAAYAEEQMKAEEQLAKFNEKHNPANGFPDSLPGYVNTMKLVVMWERLVPYFHDLDGDMKPLTKKEIGQLAHLRKAVVNGNVAYRALKWAIEHWQDFLFDIAEKTGDKLSLKQPQAGVVLKHWNIAVARSRGTQAAPKKTGGVKMLSKAEKAAL